jgi:hypothetical protein
MIFLLFRFDMCKCVGGEKEENGVKSAGRVEIVEEGNKEKEHCEIAREA